MPITRLSKSNIKRASKALRKAKKKLRARRRKLRLFSTAWKIQRARVKRLGHR
jgi:hypothetical protein